MNIIEPSFKILTPTDRESGIEQLRFIEQMARISHRSEDLQTPNTWEKFIKFVVMTKGDWSVVEHAYSTVLFRIDRGITHELVRHRLFSFTQESTRFVNYKKKGSLDFIQPSTLSGEHDNVFQRGVEMAEKTYLAMLENGASPQIARSVLPNSLATTIAVTGNLRSWHHILIMRTTQETHPDFKGIMIPLLEEFKARVPLLFDDITPGQKQADALSKPR